MKMQANDISGDWIESSDANDNINPSDLSNVVGRYAPAPAAQAEEAIAAGRPDSKHSTRTCSQARSLSIISSNSSSSKGLKRTWSAAWTSAMAVARSRVSPGPPPDTIMIGKS